MSPASRPRPYRIGKRQSGGASSGDDGLGRLGRMTKAQRARIAELTGCEHADAASLVDHLSKREVTSGLLESLSSRGLLAARLFVEASDLLPRKFVEAELERRLGGTWRDSLAELDRLGILFSSKWAGGAELLGLLPPLPKSARPFLWLLGDSRQPGDLEPTAHAARASGKLESLRHLVLALAAVATDPPRLARTGTVHSYDLAKLHRELLFAMTDDAAEIESIIDRLFALGLLAGDEEDRARIRWKRAEALFDLPPASRLPLLLSTDGDLPKITRAPGIVSASHVRRLLCASLADLPAGYWASREALQSAVTARILAADNQSPYTDLSKASTRAKAHIRSIMNGLIPCLEVHQHQEETWVRLPVQRKDDEDGEWLVQPDHEIVAPPEVPPSDLVKLASVSDLLRADIVAQFRLSPSSVARARSAGLGTRGILDRLRAKAARGLPSGLEVQVDDWGRHAAGFGVRPGATPDEQAESFWSSAEEPDPGAPPHRRPPTPSLPRPPRSDFVEPISKFRTEAARELLEEGL